MKNYRVTVNGVAYDVVVEEISGGVQTAAPTPAVAPVASANAGAVSVKAPMPGSIVKISVKVGDTVKKGDLLCVLEAMKMENEILAPQDGVIASVAVSQGATVATDALLVSMN